MNLYLFPLKKKEKSEHKRDVILRVKLSSVFCFHIITGNKM
jgi:hypothetical protein